MIHGMPRRIIVFERLVEQGQDRGIGYQCTALRSPTESSFRGY